MRRRDLFAFGYLLVSAASHADGGAFVAGVAVSLSEDPTHGQYYVSLSPRGSVDLQSSSAGTLSFDPKAAFVWNSEGRFQRLELELGSRLESKDGKPRIESRPMIIVADHEQPWAFVPMSLFPRVEGIDPRSARILSKVAQELVTAIGPVVDPNLTEVPVAFESVPCSGANQPVDVGWIKDFQRLRLNDPTWNYGMDPVFEALRRRAAREWTESPAARSLAAP